MNCPNCDFANPPEETRCFKCGAFLGKLAPGELSPPRESDSPASARAYQVRTWWRKFQSRNRLIRFWATLRLSFIIPPLASLLLPGAGQLINRRFAKAALSFGAYCGLLLWYYLRHFKAIPYNPELLPVYLYGLTEIAYFIMILHTWIIFDAYADSAAFREQRRIGIGESLGVSLVISLLLFMGLLQVTTVAGRYFTLERLVRVPNLADFDIQRNDILVYDHDYYRSHPVRELQLVENYHHWRTNRIEEGFPVEGMNPGLVLGLPGERIKCIGRGIFNGSRLLALIPPAWNPENLPETFRVPDGKYFILPSYTPGGFPGLDAVLIDRDTLGGKFIMVFSPAERRRMLP